MHKVVMIVGNTGVGKSSLGHRMLGYRAKDPDTPFVVVAVAGTPVTESMQTFTGTWFREEPGSRLTVVDTPGLNDPGDGPGSARPGSLVDTENMATAGRYLDDNPVNAVVIVMDASNPRCDAVLSRLIHIIVGKVHRKDYDKIMVVVNKYSRAPYWVHWRKEQCKPDQLRTEKEHQKWIKDEIVKSFALWTPFDYDHEQFQKQIFLLDSGYLADDAATLDKDAFVAFRDRCLSTGEIHRNDLTPGVAPVHQELQEATDRLKKQEEMAAAAEAEHQQKMQEIMDNVKKQEEIMAAAEVERQQKFEEMERVAAADRQAEEERRKDAAEELRKAQEATMVALAKAEASQEELEKERQAGDQRNAELNAANIRNLEKIEAKFEKEREAAQNDAKWHHLVAQNNALKDKLDEFKNRPAAQAQAPQECFPGSALVTVEGKGLVTMQSLSAGDKVLSIDKRGKSIYDTVCFFGHHDSNSWSSFCSISVQGNAQLVHHLLLTPTHFLPVGTTLLGLTYKYAKDVSIGDTVWMVVNEGLKERDIVVSGKVIGKDTAKAQGLYNPYTEGGLIVVNKVVASTHSHWLLDDIVPVSAIPYLPCAYQLVLKPLFTMAKLVGVSAFSDFLDQYVVPYAHEWPSLSWLKARLPVEGMKCCSLRY